MPGCDSSGQSVSGGSGQFWLKRWGGFAFEHHLKAEVVLHSPRNEYYQLYTVDKLNNMQGGLPVRYINLPVEALEEMSMKTLEKGEPVWFGCDWCEILSEF